MVALSLGLGLGLTRNTGGGFSLAAFMAAQSGGFWYDFGQTDRLFQEVVGPTPANDPNEVIGLALSKRRSGGQTLVQVIADATELVTNGDFTNGLTDWTDASTPTSSFIVSGDRALSSIVGGATARLRRTVIVTAGRLYRVSRSGTCNYSLSSTSSYSGDLLANGGNTENYVVAATTGLFFNFTTTVDGLTIDNVSVKEVSREPATQATAGFKPTFQAAGARGDGSDDRLQTGYTSTTGDAFAVFPSATIPATLAATQVLAGTMDVSANGDYAAVTTAGAFRVKVGQTVLDSAGIDLRNGVQDLAYWTEGATLYLYANGAIVASGAWTGSRPATVWNLFALNNNGTAGSFSAATLRAALVGREALTITKANQICNVY
jgi:hypothetical protein